MRTLIERYYSQYYYTTPPNETNGVTVNDNNQSQPQEQQPQQPQQPQQLQEQQTLESDILEDQYVNQHTNDLAIIGVAPSHPLLNKDIIKIEFMEKAVNNEVSGVRKAGGFRLQKNTILCTVTCSDNSVYNLRSCIKGKLLEINKEIVKDPSILKLNHATSGYLAIVEPVIKENFLENPGLITFEAYHTLRNIPIQKGPVFLKDSSNDDE